MAVRTADSDMRASQLEIRRIVIESSRLPGINRVATGAILCKLGRFVIGIRRLRIIRLMAGPAIGWRFQILSTDMTIGTADVLMSAYQLKVRRCMIKGGFPCLVCVTNHTILRELLILMIGIIGTFVVRLVAGPAVKWRVHVLAIGVTLCAADSDMRACQRKIAFTVIELSRLPGCNRMAGGAVLIVIARFVIGIRHS